MALDRSTNVSIKNNRPVPSRLARSGGDVHRFLEILAVRRLDSKEARRERGRVKRGRQKSGQKIDEWKRRIADDERVDEDEHDILAGTL